MTRRKLSSLFFLFLSLTFFALSVLLPQAAREGMVRGLEAGKSLLITLFPSMVLCGIIQKNMGANTRHAKEITLLLGLLCGFPTGAHLTAQFYRQGAITKEEAERLLFVSNQASAAFLLRFCATALQNEKLALLLTLGQGLFAFLSYLFFFGKSKEKRKALPLPSGPPFETVTESLKETALSFLFLFSGILFFSFLSSLASHLFSLNAAGDAFLSLFLELGGGVEKASRLLSVQRNLLIAWGCGWSGICVHFQTLFQLAKTDLSPRFFLLSRVLMGLWLPFFLQISQKVLQLIGI